jgi:hypothetical protein
MLHSALSAIALAAAVALPPLAPPPRTPKPLMHLSSSTRRCSIARSCVYEAYKILIQ